jgi:hypothetical protein
MEIYLGMSLTNFPVCFIGEPLEEVLREQGRLIIFGRIEVVFSFLP